MEEKIIEAKFAKNTLARIILLVGLAILTFGLFRVNDIYLTGERIYYSYGWRPYTEIYDSYFDYLLSCIVSTICFESLDLGAIMVLFGIIVIAVAGIVFWEMGKCALTVTNRQVIGKASFGKSVALPINQISAVALGYCKRITIATSSGKIHFWLLANRDEVHSALTKVINEVQVEKVHQANPAVQSDAEELKKFKELLDSGVITQEEFDAKKKQILGL